jgi:predicted RNA methylase
VAGPARPSLDRLQGALAYQQLLLGDARRNRAFARAIRARVRKGASVLDLGSGSGVWAVLAARLGARRVVAIEREAVLVPLIEAFAREAGVADRVRVIRAEAGRVRLRRGFDVVIGELVGNEAFDEGLLPVFERARDRFLRRGGALVPEWLALVAAPARVPVALGITPPILPARRVASLTTHAPRSVHAAELRTLASGRELFRIDLRTARARDRLPTAHVRFRVKDASAVSGIGVWVRMGLAPGVVLETRSGTHWRPTLLPIERLPKGPGVLEVEIDWTPARRRWTVGLAGAAAAQPASSYSPLFAWGIVRAALARR